jgi:hypothetical protein
MAAMALPVQSINAVARQIASDFFISVSPVANEFVRADDRIQTAMDHCGNRFPPPAVGSRLNRIDRM